MTEADRDNSGKGRDNGNNNLQEQLKGHSLWKKYQEKLAEIRQLRPATEAGDPSKNLGLDKLEEAASTLAHIIAADLGIPDPWREDPALRQWDKLIYNLQIALNSGREEEVETIFGELKKLLPQVEATRAVKVFSQN